MWEKNPCELKAIRFGSKLWSNKKGYFVLLQCIENLSMMAEDDTVSVSSRLSLASVRWASVLRCANLSPETPVERMGMPCNSSSIQRHSGKDKNSQLEQQNLGECGAMVSFGNQTVLPFTHSVDWVGIWSEFKLMLEFYKPSSRDFPYCFILFG